jgi:hypothetical protein
MTEMATTTAARWAVGIGDRKTLLAVATLAEASAVVARMRGAMMAAGKGSSAMPRVWVYDLSGATPVRAGEISWNGRVWPLGEWTPATRPLYDPAARGGGAS